jgi:hypothetical protein
MANKDYGTILSKGAGDGPPETFTAVGEIISTGIPEIIAEKAETTNHSSGGWRSFIPAGLKSLGEFELTLVATAAVVEDIYDDIVAEDVSTYKVTYAGTDLALDSWTFEAFPTSIKVGDAKADAPEAMTVVVKFQPTGALTVGTDAGDEWYTEVTAIGIVGGDIAMTIGGADVTLQVVTNFGTFAPNADLTFASSDSAKATVSAAGVLHADAAGTTYIHVSITDKAGIDGYIVVTVS